MFNNWVKQTDREVFIDGRMLIETGQIFTVLPGNEESYRKVLYDDSEIPAQNCSLKATSHSGALIASLMVSVYNNYIYNRETKRDLREVPFQFDYELPSMTIGINKEELDTYGNESN